MCANRQRKFAGREGEEGGSKFASHLNGSGMAAEMKGEFSDLARIYLCAELLLAEWEHQRKIDSSQSRVLKVSMSRLYVDSRMYTKYMGGSWRGDVERDCALTCPSAEIILYGNTNFNSPSTRVDKRGHVLS